MRVAVWGAGAIGTAVARRLMTMPAISEVRWINRSPVDGQALDMEHGLSFAPTCHHISAHRQEEAADVLPRSDLLVLTLGAGVMGLGTVVETARLRAALSSSLRHGAGWPHPSKSAYIPCVASMTFIG